MKKLFILPAALVCTFALFFVGCGDDDEPSCTDTYCSCIGDGMDMTKNAECAATAIKCLQEAGSAEEAGSVPMCD